ncbi:MAG: hypothetical protein WB676_02535 [Bryobacteraceae bacterium]
MSKTVLLAVIAMAPLLFAQGEPNAVQSRPPGAITRMLRVQHADACVVWRLLESTGAKASCDKALNVLVVSGTPTDVGSLEQTAKELDTESARFRSSDVQMTVYVIGASSIAGESSQMPQGLESTVNQLKPLFPYNSYQLLETTVARARVGDQAIVQGTLQRFNGQAEAPGLPPTYTLHFTISGVTTSGASAIVHVNNFDFGSNLPYVGKSPSGQTYSNSFPASVRTNFDLATGQKVVVGKAGAAGSNAIFLIVEAKVVD